MFLVTGITGLTGRFLFQEIRKSGKINDLRCLVRETSDLSWMGNDKPDFCYGDVQNVKDIMKALDGVSGIIHLVNIRSSPQIIEACKITGIKRVVFVNTTGVFSKYQAYSSLYRELEEKIFASGLDYTIIRPTMIYGNSQDKNIHKLIKLMNRFPVFPVVGKGQALMQPIYAGDLAKVIYQAYVTDQSIGQDYNVAGREPLSYLELLHEIARALEKEVRFIHIPYSLALLAGKIGDLIPNGLVDLEKIQRLSEDKNFDYFKASKDLNFCPRTFSEGVRLEVQALRTEGVI